MKKKIHYNNDELEKIVYNADNDGNVNLGWYEIIKNLCEQAMQEEIPVDEEQVKVEKELEINKIADDIHEEWQVVLGNNCTSNATYKAVQFVFILRKLAELQYQINQIKL